MQHMLLAVHEATEQCVVVVLDELSCRWSDTGPDSTTDDSFDRQRQTDSLQFFHSCKGR